MDDDDFVPFRWDLSRREQLGGLLAGEAAFFPVAFVPEFREIAAKVVARAGDADLVFVGRSPENIFDYLSGTFSVMRTPRPLTLLQGSLRLAHLAPLKTLEPLLAYFRSERLDPNSLASFGKAVRFVDVVATGSTFVSLVRIIRDWCERERADWNVVKGRIGFVGLTKRKKNSPNTFRWQQGDDWLELGERIFRKNISVSPLLWHHIADYQDKVTHPHTARRWGSAYTNPPRHRKSLMALRLAAKLYDWGRDDAERQRFARALAQQSEMSEPWLRRLVMDLR